MNIYGLIIAFAVGMALGGSWMSEWKDGQIARHEKAQLVAQAKIDDAARAAVLEAENKISDMVSAYEAGEANAKTVIKTVYVKGQSYVATQAVFQNPACVVPADGMLAINRARAGMRTPTDSGEPVAAVPAAGAVEGRQAGNVVPASSSGHGTVGGVPTTPAVSSGNSAVPGQSVRPVPKPKPVS